MVNQGGGWYLIQVRDVTIKKISMKYFCIIKEKIAYLEREIQSSTFYSFYLFLSILLCNSALVSDSNTYIWISNCIQIFELYPSVRIYIPMLKECVFSTWGWFNNYVTLKLPFLTHLPLTITLCYICSREPSCVTSRSAQTPPLLLPNKKRNFRI